MQITLKFLKEVNFGFVQNKTLQLLSQLIREKNLDRSLFKILLKTRPG